MIEKEKKEEKQRDNIRKREKKRFRARKLKAIINNKTERQEIRARRSWKRTKDHGKTMEDDKTM